MVTKNQLIAHLRAKNNGLEDKIEAVRNHLKQRIETYLEGASTRVELENVLKILEAED